MSHSNETRTLDANRDPISGAPGAHPIGTGVGAAVGAVVGGLTGKGIAEAIDPTQEDAYWRDNYSERPYVEQGSSYDNYGPAYGFGVEAFSRYPGRAFDEMEPEMSERWGAASGSSSLAWDRARPAARDAWDRVNGRT